MKKGAGYILTSLLFFVFLLLPVPLRAQDAAGSSTLAAFSLTAARNAILSEGGALSEEVRSVGYITRVWAVLIDYSGDVVIVGERDPSIPGIQLDDVVVALRTMEKIAGDENPGVSIEPVTPGKYSPHQVVKYFGGIENTHYGMVVLEADLLLKLASLGFVLTGVEGFPSEWDLDVENEKAGRLLAPWEISAGTSWFFPQKINMIHKDDMAVVTSVKMQVRTKLEAEVDAPEKYLSIDDTTEMLEYLDEWPEAATVVYARLFTQHFSDIAERHHVLVQLENLLALSGLFAEVLDGKELDSLRYWMEDYEVQHVDTPKEVPTISRGVNGLAYGTSVNGGVRAIYSAKDGWTDAVLSKSPKYLKEAVLGSRPLPDAISWLIPLELGKPTNWTADSLSTVRSKELRRLSGLPAVHEEGLFKRLVAEKPEPLVTPGWHPPTEGNHLIAFKGRIQLSSGGLDMYSPDGDFSYTVATADVSLGVLAKLQWVYRNRFELSLTIPIILKGKTKDIPTGLPGISDHIIGYVGGVDSPVLANNIVLMDGIKDGRWKLPYLVLKNSVVVPESFKAFEGYLTGEELKEDLGLTFGSDEWHGSHGIQAAVPVSHNVYLGGSADYQTDWKKATVGERKTYGANIRWTLDMETGTSLGFQILTSFTKDVLAGSSEKRWIGEGKRYVISLSSPTRTGLNSFKFGWYAPSSFRSDLKGAFLLSIDLDGISLWDHRKWF